MSSAAERRNADYFEALSKAASDLAICAMCASNAAGAFEYIRCTDCILSPTVAHMQRMATAMQRIAVQRRSTNGPPVRVRVYRGQGIPEVGRRLIE